MTKTFWDLPAEVRNKIYSSLLVHPRSGIFIEGTDDKRPFRAPGNENYQLLSVHSVVNYEGRAILYGRNKFYCCGHWIGRFEPQHYLAQYAHLIRYLGVIALDIDTASKQQDLVKGLSLFSKLVRFEFPATRQHVYQDMDVRAVVHSVVMAHPTLCRLVENTNPKLYLFGGPLQHALLAGDECLASEHEKEIPVRGHWESKCNMTVVIEDIDPQLPLDATPDDVLTSLIGEEESFPDSEAEGSDDQMILPCRDEELTHSSRSRKIRRAGSISGAFRTFGRCLSQKLHIEKHYKRKDPNAPSA